MAEHPVLKSTPTLGDIQKYIGDANEFRHHNTDAQYCLLLLAEEVGELAKAVRKTIGGRMDVAKPESGTVDEEAADVLWVLIAICNSLGIDLEQSLRSKEEKNKRRIWK